MLRLILSNLRLIILFYSRISWYLILWGLALIRVFSIFYLYSPIFSWEMYNSFLAQDSISSILISLTFWISFIIIIASQRGVIINKNNNLLFSFFLLLINLILIITFCISRILYFYFLFEASLIPILLIILGWGYQPERLQAGIYIIIYTVAASLPLLLVIMWVGQKRTSFNIIIISILRTERISSFFWGYNLIIILILTAFLVKLPIFSVHLWLPKAHVEAPVAGSIILAAILLKLGGYGIFRMFQYFNFSTRNIFIIIFSLAIWGGVLTRVICFRQIDFKSLIAYSSIGHISLILAGVFSNSSWGWGGGVVLIISHGFCSSALFALANITYEKTHTRRLMLTKGILLLMPRISLWWFLFCVINIAAPPRINLLGEIIIFPSTIFRSVYFVFPLGLISFIAALYRIYLYTASQHGRSPKYTRPFSSLKSIAFLLLLIHWIPVNIIILKRELIFLWAC
jgi:NADH-ubiquinone oxidoreductase chain 4